MRRLFLLSAFASSALLFVVEPLAARMVLPTFGGSPQVWNASLVFFQGVLLLGYLYAHLTTSRMQPRNQRILHVIVLLAGAAVLPMSTHTGLFQAVRASAAGSPETAGLVLIALFGLVGLPFFALSANSSILQRWFAGSRDKDAKQPWFLYAAGNVGSMLALIAYPSVVEPLLGLHEQTRVWAIGYSVLVLLIGICAWATIRWPAETKPEEAATPTLPPTNRERAKWLILAAVPSSLLLGVTTYLTSNIAPVPLLWVIPLSLYLLTFILVFARKPNTPDVFLGRILPLVALPLAITMILESAQPIVPLGMLHLAVFFAAAWMCHSRLSRSRPDPTHLTEFYFWIALGGVIGGAFNALLSPVLFNSLAEYPIALVAACLLRPSIGKKSTRSPYRALIYPTAVGLITMLLVFAVQLGPSILAHRPTTGMPPGPMRTFLAIGIPTILCFFAVDRPIVFGLALAAVFFVDGNMHVSSRGYVILSERSFFGVHRVIDIGGGTYRELVHGNTLHGMQDLNDPHTPLTYYYPTGPIGVLMKKLPKDRCAFVGLGVGSLAAYGKPGQHFTFYEIDPVVYRIASNPQYFTFLRDSKADVHVVLGDARLTMARTNERYGLIVLDAFSSDAIPVHLLTEEAIKMYLSKLEPGGMIAFHISNHYLELQPILIGAAKDLGLVRLYAQDGATQDEFEAGKRQSEWVLMTRRLVDVAPLTAKHDWDDPDADPKRPWTDDYSNVLGAFKANED